MIYFLTGAVIVLAISVGGLFYVVHALADCVKAVLEIELQRSLQDVRKGLIGKKEAEDE